MKLIELTINDFDFDSGVDGVALVHDPAIDIDFYYFNKMSSEHKFESYDDYPQSARENAQRALNWVEEHGWGDCGEDTGKQRAHQLAKGEPISEETIARMASFKRHQQHKDVPYSEGCGGLMWDSWGGTEGIEWASRKLQEIRKEEEFDYDLNNLPDYVVQAIIDKGEEANVMTSEGWTVKSIKKVDETSHKFYNIQSNPNAESDYDNMFSRVRYAYRGPLSSNSRNFCRRMVAANKLYRYEDVITLQTQLSAEDSDRKIIPRPQGAGIELFSYRGGVNCKHHWYEIEFAKDPSKERQRPILNRDKINQPGKSVLGQKTGQLDNKRVNFHDTYKFSMDEEGRIVSPAMIPNMKIPRRANDGSVYHVYFSEETIRDIQDKFMRNGHVDRINLEHTPMVLGSDAAYVFESWIKDDENDKSNKYGFNDLPVGTWFLGIRILDETIKDAIKKGTFKGLSVEGMFNEKIVFGNQGISDDEILMSTIKDTLSKLK